LRSSAHAAWLIMRAPIIERLNKTLFKTIIFTYFQKRWTNQGNNVNYEHTLGK
jgi:hypothetical protein